MKTLADVLRTADPAASETRSQERRALARAAVLAILSGPRQVHFDVRPAPRWRTALVAAVLAVAAVATAVVAWQHASVDAVAAMQFEARIEGSNETIIDTHDIVTAEAASLHDVGPGGSTRSSFGIALTFTREGAAKLREATEAHVGEHLELLVDGNVVMSPTIRAPISDSAMLTGDYTRAEAERIADGLLKGKLEIPGDKR